MSVELSTLDSLQAAYKASVDHLIATIREEEALASVNHNEAQLDAWDAASDREHEAHEQVKEAKKNYKDALREKFFNF